MELETQKAVGSIPAPASGIVTKIHVKEGMEISVGQLLITIREAGGEAAASPSPGTPPPVERRAPEASSRRQPENSETPTLSYHYRSSSGAPPPAAPSIRKLARELDIDLTRIKGSEAGGRIVIEDLRAYIRRLQQIADAGATQPLVQVAPAPPRSEVEDFSKWGAVRREKMSALRRTVSRRMVESWTTIPKINQFDDADITALLALRKKHAPAYQKKGAHLTLTSFLLITVARALVKHPRANASVDEGAGEIVFKDYRHIGVAVDTEAGLIVPVLRDADKKNLLDISRELSAVTEKTRKRKISLEELQGGTFAISNQGSIGGGHFTPIIYSPQVAILGVGQGSPKPVVVDGKIAIRTLLPLCLSYDHRVLDGGDAVRFLREIIAGLESFTEAEVRIN